MRISRLKKTLVVIFILTFCVNFTALADAQIKTQIKIQIDSIISILNLRYAPDSRITLFNISVDSDCKSITLRGETNNEIAYLELKQILAKYSILYTDSIRFLPDTELDDKIYAVVNNSFSNHRVKPSYSGELTTQALLGMPLNVLEKQSYWYRVQTPDNYIAWVDNGGIQLMNKAEINDWLSCRKIVYWKQSGFSYEKPNDNSQVVSDLAICNVLRYISSTGKYILVAYPDGRKAYVKKSECIDYELWLVSKSPTPEELISTAKKFMGLPYLWGGTSSKAVDCSGYTKMTFLVHGVILQRDASQQVNYGEKTPRMDNFDHLKKGDLLFFGDKKTEISRVRVTHVAIYIGDKKFIHASGNVSINSFNPLDSVFSQYRYNTFLSSSNYISKIGNTGIVKIKDSEFYKIRK